MEGNGITLHLEKFVNDMKLEIQTCLDQENWLRQDASTSGQLPIEDSLSPNHCHTFKTTASVSGGDIGQS